jgi:ABC-type antimicrobial peptide transport system permease subunit
VAVLGASVQEELFGNQPPLGKSIKVNGQSFRVNGAFRPKGNSVRGDPDDQVWVPITTAMRRVLGRDYINRISIQAVSEARMDEAQRQVEDVMRKQHRIPQGEEVDVRIRSQADLLETAQQQTGIFTLLLASIAGVSLFVGGIGIMNIMLVTVTERTREIGIRKAIGAKTSDVRNQFLIEAITMSVVGGLLGVAFGLIASTVVASHTGWNTVVTTESIALSFGFSALVGVLFGVYPATKASRLNPIQALRHE